MTHGSGSGVGCHCDPVEILDNIPASALRLLRRLEMRCAGELGHCREKARGLSEHLGVSDRQVRRLLRRLEEDGLIAKTRRRIRWSERVVTRLGERVLVLFRRRYDGVSRARAVSGQMSAHKGMNLKSEGSIPSREISNGGHRSRVDPASYTLPRRRVSLQCSTWNALASWMGTARSVSWARCRVAHEAFLGLCAACERSREWRRYSSVTGVRRGETLVRLVLEEALRVGADFGTVETALAWAAAVVKRCVREFRLPGKGRG